MTEDDRKPTDRSDLAEAYLKAIREEEVDAVVGTEHLIMLRLREVEERLRLSEARYRSIVESQFELICRWTADRSLRFVNDAFCRFYQQPREKLLGKKFGSTIHELDRERIEQQLADLDLEKPEVEIECREVSSRRIRWLNWSNRAVVDRHGRVVEFQSVGRDITDRKQMEEELLKSREKLQRRVKKKDKRLKQTAEVFQTILDEIPVMICLYDESGRISLANRTCKELLGWPLEETPATSGMVGRFAGIESQAVVWGLVQENAGIWRDLIVHCPDGSHLDIAWSSVVLPDGSRIAIGIDISERKQAEIALQQMSRRTLEALENDRQAVAKELHDSIAASLAALKFSLEARVEGMGQNPTPEHMSLEQIIEHLTATIKETKRISARLRPSALDDFGFSAALSAHIRDFCDFYPRTQVTHQIEVADEEIPESLRIVLYRILQEALANVGKYSQADRVTVKLVRIDDALQLTVADNGCGFDPKHRLKRNDPLSGFGLRSMQERSEMCGGSFHIRSEAGKGCTVFVSLPLS